MTNVVSQRSKIKTLKTRAHYDRRTINSILDEAIFCHVGFVDGDQPFVIPMACARWRSKVILHGHAKTRILTTLAQEIPICIAITLLDGLVLARSQFHHSLNYRSVVLFGTATEVVDTKTKEKLLNTLVAHLAPGREKTARKPDKQELKATKLLLFNVEEASAKIREGPPIDGPGDMDLDVWAGVIPIHLKKGKPIPDQKTIERLSSP